MYTPSGGGWQIAGWRNRITVGWQNLIAAGSFAEGYSALAAMRAGQLEQQGIKAPLWRGQRVGRLTVINLWGWGDALQFSRYIPKAVEMASRSTIVCRASLASLFARLPGVTDIVRMPEGATYTIEDSACEFATADMLPAILGLGHESTPYLTTDQDKVERRRECLGPGLNVGLTIRGSTLHAHSNAVPIECLGPLLAVPGVTWHAITQDRVVPEWCRQYSFEDFDDTAALMSSLDLVISVDTSVAHLAGALGRPVWIMLPTPGCWRWENDPERTPLYPTARLFRQTERGQWTAVIDRVALELRRLVNAKAERR